MKPSPVVSSTIPAQDRARILKAAENGDDPELLALPKKPDQYLAAVGRQLSKLSMPSRQQIEDGCRITLPDQEAAALHLDHVGAFKDELVRRCVQALKDTILADK